MEKQFKRLFGFISFNQARINIEVQKVCHEVILACLDSI